MIFRISEIKLLISNKLEEFRSHLPMSLFLKSFLEQSGLKWTEVAALQVKYGNKV